MSVVINAALFQVVWFATVAGAGAGMWWAGLPALAAFAIWQLPRSRWPRADLALLACGVALGLAVDSLLIAGGWLRFATPQPSPQFAPVWILVLWAGFALTVNHSLAFLKRRPALAMLFGGLGGPLAYLGAQRLFAAVAFTAPQWHVLAALAVAWAISMPLLAAIGARLVDREEARPA